MCKEMSVIKMEDRGGTKGPPQKNPCGGHLGCQEGSNEFNIFSIFRHFAVLRHFGVRHYTVAPSAHYIVEFLSFIFSCLIQGCQMVYFQTRKSLFGKVLGGVRWKNVDML
jgi:hypothetical protein